MKVILATIIAVHLCAAVLAGQATAEKSSGLPLQPLAFLLGNWEAKGGSELGESEGGSPLPAHPCGQGGQPGDHVRNRSPRTSGVQDVHQRDIDQEVKSRNDPFIREVIALVRAIPPGRVATYGHIAALAGDPRGARQVVRALHSCSEKEGLPWHRVVNARGGISLRPGRGGEEQARRLKAEGLTFDCRGRLDLDAYQWDLWAKRPRRRGESFLGLDLRELRSRQK